MLTRIGVNRAIINHLVSDNLDTMEMLVTQYKDDIKDFYIDLKTINKGMQNADNPVRFSPVVTDYILAVIHYFIQAVTCFHMIADIDKVNRNKAIGMIEPYRIYR